MAKHSRTRKGGQGRAPVHGSPQWVSRRKSPTYRRRQALYAVVGQAYDRDPCPHVLRTGELVHDPLDPEDVRDGVTFLRTVDAPCVRPADHVRESRVIPVDKHGATITVPDEAARMHADDTGRVWA